MPPPGSLNPSGAKTNIELGSDRVWASPAPLDKILSMFKFFCLLDPAVGAQDYFAPWGQWGMVHPEGGHLLTPLWNPYVQFYFFRVHVCAPPI